MFFDEFHFHHARGLGRWERVGHPLDSLSLIAGLVPLLFPYSSVALFVFVALALFSCVFVTKDEWVHASECPPFEGWLHALLFVLHPLVFVGFGALWFASSIGWEGVTPTLFRFLLMGKICLVALFLCYQVGYWLVLGKGRYPRKNQENPQ